MNKNSKAYQTAETAVAWSYLAVAGISTIYMGGVLVCGAKDAIVDRRQQKKLKKLSANNPETN